MAELPNRNILGDVIRIGCAVTGLCEPTPGGTPSIPALPPPSGPPPLPQQPFQPLPGLPTTCAPGFSMVNGVCQPNLQFGPQQPAPQQPNGPGFDPTPVGQTPAERGPGVAGTIASPGRVCVNTLKCPKFANGKIGVLWMHPISGEVVCLPRGTNGTGFGLMRKNKPRKPAFISAAAVSRLRKRATTEKKAIEFAKLAGLARRKPPLKK